MADWIGDEEFETAVQGWRDDVVPLLVIVAAFVALFLFGAWIFNL
jgi:hypothetical protein